jgi:tRNA wybutosine-synthesizing protein 1
MPNSDQNHVARGLNIREVEGYAKLIEKAKPTYVEAKRTCTSVSPDSDWAMKSMPSHDEIREFSTQLARETGYNLIDESIESRVVLLSKLRNSMRFGAG